MDHFLAALSKADPEAPLTQFFREYLDKIIRVVEHEIERGNTMTDEEIAKSIGETAALDTAQKLPDTTPPKFTANEAEYESLKLIKEQQDERNNGLNDPEQRDSQEEDDESQGQQMRKLDAKADEYNFAEIGAQSFRRKESTAPDDSCSLKAPNIAQSLSPWVKKIKADTTISGHEKDPMLQAQQATHQEADSQPVERRSPGNHQETSDGHPHVGSPTWFGRSLLEDPLSDIDRIPNFDERFMVDVFRKERRWIKEEEEAKYKKADDEKESQTEAVHGPTEPEHVRPLKQAAGITDRRFNDLVQYAQQVKRSNIEQVLNGPPLGSLSNVQYLRLLSEMRRNDICKLQREEFVLLQGIRKDGPGTGSSIPGVTFIKKHLMILSQMKELSRINEIEAFWTLIEEVSQTALIQKGYEPHEENLRIITTRNLAKAYKEIADNSYLVRFWVEHHTGDKDSEDNDSDSADNSTSATSKVDVAKHDLAKPITAVQNADTERNVYARPGTHEAGSEDNEHESASKVHNQNTQARAVTSLRTVHNPVSNTAEVAPQISDETLAMTPNAELSDEEFYC
ncbi:MAG: hypothetical protein Q9170_002025 [Blastenia crenularia]